MRKEYFQLKSKSFPYLKKGKYDLLCILFPLKQKLQVDDTIFIYKNFCLYHSFRFIPKSSSAWRESLSTVRFELT